MTTQQNILAVYGGSAARYSPLPMTLNASGQAGSAGTAAGSIAVSLTTTLANTILVALVMKDGGHAFTVTSLADNHGLTWARRAQSGTILVNGSDEILYEEWWAAAPVAQTYTVTASYSGTTDVPGMMVFAVSGVASSTAPFATDGAMPKNASSNGSVGTPTATPLTTANANTFCFFGLLIFRAGTQNSPTVGAINGVTATQIALLGISTFDYLFAEYVVNTTPMNIASAAIGVSETFYVGYADALVG